MIVKDYLNYLAMLDKEYVGHLVYFVLDEMENYWTTNPGLIKTQENFHDSMNTRIIDTLFSYFPELNPRKTELKPFLTEKTKELSEELFDTLFDIVTWYLRNPDGKKEIITYDFHIRTEEDMMDELEEIAELTQKYSPEQKKMFNTSMINHFKNSNHFYGFNKALYLAALSCATDAFLEIPELSSNAIRYIDSHVAFETHWFIDEFYDLIASDLIIPYNEGVEYDEEN